MLLNFKKNNTNYVVTSITISNPLLIKMSNLWSSASRILVYPSSKLTLFITKFLWTFVSKQTFNETALFVQRNFCSKSLKLSLELSHGISTKVHLNKKQNSRISVALLLHSTVHLIFVCRRWSEYCWTISKTKLKRLFNNLHWAQCCNLIG